MPSKEQLVAWAYASVLAQGSIIRGAQSLPLHRLPLMITAQRKFSYSGALLDFSVGVADSEPGARGKGATRGR
jgi:hypothetical protein